MTCERCGEPVKTGGNGTTLYYIPARPARKHEPACPLCGGLDVNAVKAAEEENARA